MGLLRALASAFFLWRILLAVELPPVLAVVISTGVKLLTVQIAILPFCVNLHFHVQPEEERKILHRRPGGVGVLAGQHPEGSPNLEILPLAGYQGGCHSVVALLMQEDHVPCPMSGRSPIPRPVPVRESSNSSPALRP